MSHYPCLRQHHLDNSSTYFWSHAWADSTSTPSSAAATYHLGALVISISYRAASTAPPRGPAISGRDPAICASSSTNFTADSAYAVIPSLQISHSVNPHSVPGVSASHVPGVSASHVPVVTASRVPVVSASPVPVVSASLVKVSEPMMKCLLLLFMVTIVTGNTSCYGTWLCCIYPL